MKLIITIMTIVAFTMANVGCCAFRSSTQVLTVTANPKEAVVIINGIKYHPPVQVPVKRNQPAIIQCECDGFEPQMRIIDTHWNGTAVLDTLGFIFVFFPAGIGLLTPGAHSLDYTTVQMDLYHPYVPPAPVEPVKPTNRR